MFRLRERLSKPSTRHVGCPTCQGKGVRLIVNVKTEPCISCRGTGRERNARCFVCGGTGAQTVTHTEVKDCDTCAGTGWIVERDPAHA